MRALVIVLPDRRQRLFEIQEALGDAAECEPLEAVDARKAETLEQLLPIVDAETRFNLGRGRQMHVQISTRGAVGCFASHMRAWRAAAAAQTPTLVVEDDFVLDPAATPAELRSVLGAARRLLEAGELDLVSLGYIETGPRVRRFKKDIVRTLTPFFGTQMYMVSPAGARKLLALLPTITAHVDGAIGLAAGGSAGQRDEFRLGVSGRNFYDPRNEIASTIQHNDSRGLIMSPADYEHYYTDYYRDPVRYSLATGQRSGAAPSSQPKPVRVKFVKLGWYNDPAFVIAIICVLGAAVVALSVALAVVATRQAKETKPAAPNRALGELEDDYAK